MNPKHYFLYARKSSEAEERQALSIEAQLTELGDFAKREGIKIKEQFIESKSAKQPGRSEFNRMLECVYASKEPVGILSWHPDRLARNSVDGGQIIYLIDIGKVSALKFPTFWFEPTPQGLFMLQVAFGQSKYYSDNLSQNIKRGIRQKLRRGEYYNKAPWGYVNNHKTRNIEPHPLQSKIIRRAFEEYATGQHTFKSLGERLLLWGVQSKVNKRLSLSAVQRMLTNRVYIGLFAIKGEVYEGSFEPIISKDLWDRVQAVLKEKSRPRKRKRKHDFPFTGLMSCGECGAAISAQFAKGKSGGIYRYYRCTKKHGDCGQSYLQEKHVAEQLREAVNAAAIPAEWEEKMLAQIDIWEREEVAEMRSVAQNLDGQIAEVEKRLDKLVNTFLDGMIEQPIYLKKKDELMQEKTRLIERKEDLGQQGALWNEPLREWVKAARMAEKIALSEDFQELKNFFEKIGTNPKLLDKKILFDFAPTFENLNKIKCLQTQSPASAGRVLGVAGSSSPAWWRRRDSNPRPNKESSRFLHA